MWLFLHRGCTVLAFPGSLPWTSAPLTPTRSSLVRVGPAQQAKMGVGECGRRTARRMPTPVLSVGLGTKEPLAEGPGGLTHFWISFWSPPGGADKNVVVFDKSSEQILATLKGHTKKVTSVVFHPSQVSAPLAPSALISEPCCHSVRSQNQAPAPVASLVK